MIPKPTTMEQAVENAILAAEQAHAAAERMYSNAGPGATSKVWSDVSAAWSAIANVLPMREMYANDTPPEVNECAPMDDPADEDVVTLTGDNYRVLRALAIEEIERRMKKGPMDSPVITEGRIQQAAHKKIVITPYGPGAWGLSLR